MTEVIKDYLDKYEKGLEQSLGAYLEQRGRLDKRNGKADNASLMPDIEDEWKAIAEVYLPDGVREFQGYPLVSLGWMMYVGMAVAKMWDTDWEEAKQKESIYTYLRDLRGYDCMDEAIREDILSLTGDAYKAEEKLVGECAQMVLNAIRHENIEPGTPMAYHAYIRSLHQLYLMGAATQLHRSGYKLSRL